MTFKNAWFEGRSMIQNLPQDCIDDMRGSGRKDEAVAYWVRELGFDGPAWLIREHLKGHGAWDKRELCNHRENLQRLLWIHASDLGQDPDNGPLYLAY